jgi:hypothetical protein
MSPASAGEQRSPMENLKEFGRRLKEWIGSAGETQQEAADRVTRTTGRKYSQARISRIVGGWLPGDDYLRARTVRDLCATYAVATVDEHLALAGLAPDGTPLAERVAEASALYQVAELAAEKAARLLVDEMRSSPHPAALFWDEVRQLNEETGAGIQVYLHEGSAGLTVERVRGYVQAIRNTLKEEGLLPQKGEP